jgi:hypothetical protein
MKIAFPPADALIAAPINATIGEREAPADSKLPAAVLLGRPGRLIVSHEARAIELRFETPADARRLAAGLAALADTMESDRRLAAATAADALARITAARPSGQT